MNGKVNNLNNIINAFPLYKFIRAISTPFRSMNAYRMGLIDDRGNFLQDPDGKIPEFDKLVIKLKALINTSCSPKIKS